MIIGAILISLAILVLVVIFVTRPLNKAELVEEDEAVSDTKQLSFEYQLTLNRIRDLEQEYQEEKTNPEDYQQRREMLNQEAAEILQKLDIEKSVKGKITQ